MLNQNEIEDGPLVWIDPAHDRLVSEHVNLVKRAVRKAKQSEAAGGTHQGLKDPLVAGRCPVLLRVRRVTAQPFPAIVAVHKVTVLHKRN
jgi:hypothetical protein